MPRQAVSVFGARKGIAVKVKAGPTPAWKDRALTDADLVFSGAEHMMTDFIQKDLPGLIDSSTMQTLYLRPSAILVRRGNPTGRGGQPLHDIYTRSWGAPSVSTATVCSPRSVSTSPTAGWRG